MKVTNKGSVLANLIRFSLPFFFANLLQTLYGLVDLYIIGRFNGPEVTAAVSCGSQIMHMVTVIIVALTVGITVLVGQALGGGKAKQIGEIVGNATVFYGLFAIAFTAILLICVNPILRIMAVPTEAFEQTKTYILLCFAGIPLIVAINAISALFRGMGDSKHPMYFVGASCIINIFLDYVLIGICGLSSLGAALGTVLAQLCSVALAFLYLKRHPLAFSIHRTDFHLRTSQCKSLIAVGGPIALQDGFIQISFLVITMIANGRGVVIAASVGVVEKVIGIMFLVPSSMLAAVSSLVAYDCGAGMHERARKQLYCAMGITTVIGVLFTILTQFFPEWLVGLFTKDLGVIHFGGQYLRAYVVDCVFAGLHFCFSGFFTAYKKAFLSFIHNVASVLLFRIPLSYSATIHYPDNLFPMGLAAPIGSVFSAALCFLFFIVFFRNIRGNGEEEAAHFTRFVQE